MSPPAPGTAASPAVAVDDYLRFCAGLHEICGIDLTHYKRPQMERRLRAFYARRGCDRLSDSLDRLRRDETELEALLDRVTINVSHLWRHPEQWRQLERDVLPTLAASRPILAWSAGCSYGAEAYTLAAVCSHAIPDAKVRIVGTDIDKRVIARARRGEFTDGDAHNVPERTMTRWFDRHGTAWRAKQELRTMIRFEVADLLHTAPQPASYDLILCRNTLIYFSEQTRDRVCAQLAGALRPGGWLVVGATERVWSPDSLGLRPVHPFMLRKS